MRLPQRCPGATTYSLFHCHHFAANIAAATDTLHPYITHHHHRNHTIAPIVWQNYNTCCTLDQVSVAALIALLCRWYACTIQITTSTTEVMPHNMHAVTTHHAPVAKYDNISACHLSFSICKCLDVICDIQFMPITTECS